MRSAGKQASLRGEMRVLLYAASVLVFLMGIQLFVLSDYTAEYFAWEIKPPLTAATLGAAYWASCILEFQCARQSAWSHARVGIPAVFVFTTLTLMVSVIHVKLINVSTLQGASWMIVYGVVPPVMALIWWLQWRQKETTVDNSAVHDRLPKPLLGMMSVQAGIMLGLGVVSLFVPQVLMGIWPWKLSPLTGRLVASWLVGLGVFLGQCVNENSWRRIDAGLLSLFALGLLELIASLRYLQFFVWQRIATWAYFGFVLSLLGVAVAAMLLSTAAHGANDEASTT